MAVVAEVVAAAADRDRIPFQTLSVRDGDRIPLLNGELAVLDVPAHTRAHVAYVLMGSADQPAALFCGDTLFAAGCGRLFEGTPEQMHRSLQRLAALPETTRVWCAHEYTEGNLRWAAAQRPGDRAIAERLGIRPRLLPMQSLLATQMMPSLLTALRARLRSTT